eukprot:988435-Prymnesium_polylepis.1
MSLRRGPTRTYPTPAFPAAATSTLACLHLHNTARACTQTPPSATQTLSRDSRFIHVYLKS